MECPRIEIRIGDNTFLVEGVPLAHEQINSLLQTWISAVKETDGQAVAALATQLRESNDGLQGVVDKVSGAVGSGGNAPPDGAR